MLTLSHIPIACKPRSGQSADDWLGAIAFERAGASAENIGIAAGTPLIAPQHSFIETWRTRATVVEGQCGALHYRHDGEILFGSIALNETDFVSAGGDTALQKATAAAYRQIFQLLDQLQFTHLWRVWNFIPQINADSDGIERYRQFNIARSAAFLHSGRATEGNVPAASAVGCNGVLTIYFLAGNVAPIAIENPRQISAYQYPSEYGPRSPIFSRASLIALDAQQILFISGTASIVGHRTVHAGDIGAQTRELLLNIDAVIDAANASTQHHQFARGDLIYRVYLRCAADFPQVHAVLQQWLGCTPHAVYVQADICRADLLVEIEASGGHSMEWSC